MTKLEAIKERARIQPGPGWPDWVHRTDDDRRWLLARLEEFIEAARTWAVPLCRCDDCMSARRILAALDEP